MQAKATNNNSVNIEVQVVYNEVQSNPMQNEFAFIYHIRIQNKSKHSVQLLRRHWHIHDTALMQREVEGEGVIGQKPILHPSEIFTYSSGCIITSELGKMFGHYIFKNLNVGNEFLAVIPEFALVAPSKLN